MTGDNKRVVHHHERIRIRARVLSWVFAPLTVVAAVVWLLFSGTVCWNERATPLELQACGFAQVLPDSSALFVVIGLVVLFLALVSFQEEQFALARNADESLALHYVRKVRAGYHGLDAVHQRTVRFAIEMSLWSAVLMLGLAVFYFSELAFPLGLLTLAALGRISYSAIYRLRNITKKPEPPQGSTVTNP